MLMLFAPGAPREAYFEAVAEIASGRQLTREEWLEICLSHDSYFVQSDADKPRVDPFTRPD
jgi:hypothetical protein